MKFLCCSYGFPPGFCSVARLALPLRPSASGFSAYAKKIGMARMSIIGILVGCVGCVLTFFAGSNMAVYIAAGVFAAAGSVPINMMKHLS